MLRSRRASRDRRAQWPSSTNRWSASPERPASPSSSRSMTSASTSSRTGWRTATRRSPITSTSSGGCGGTWASHRITPMLKKIGSLTLLALGAACTHQPAPQPVERHYTMMLGANHAGSQVTRVDGNRWIVDFEFNDRGRGPKTTTEIRVNDHFLTTFEKTTGVDYLKAPADESFSIEGTTARWHNKAEDGQRSATDAFYVSMFGPPEETGLLAKALLASPNHRLPLLPAGEASIEQATAIPFNGKQIVDYAISGLGFRPFDVWLDPDGVFVGYVSACGTLVRDGYEPAIKPMLDAQQAAADRRGADLTKRLTHKPPGGAIVIRNANLFDSVNGVIVPATTVVIRGDRIAGVGPSAVAPEGATVIDAASK